MIIAVAAVSWALVSTANATVTHVATLTPPAGSPALYGLAASDTTVVAAAPGGGLVPGQGALDVFTKPTAGWSSVPQAATLIDPVAIDAPILPALSGGTVVVGATALTGSSYEDVFQEPAGGWSGTVRPSATLREASVAPIPLEASGDTVLAGLSLFRKPSAAGWSGTLKPVGALFPASAYSDGSIQALSGELVASSSSQLGAGHVCPCISRLSLFTKPPGGWRGTIAAPPAITSATENGPLVSALVGRELFVTNGLSIEVYQVTGSSGQKVAPPRLSKLSLAGVAHGHPRLAFTISTKANDPPIQSFALTLPVGLSFTKSHLRLKKNVSIAGMPLYDYTVAVAHGALIVQLVSTADRLTVHLSAGALRESQGLAIHARQAKTLLVRATLQATDASGDSTKMHLALHGK